MVRARARVRARLGRSVGQHERTEEEDLAERDADLAERGAASTSTRVLPAGRSGHLEVRGSREDHAATHDVLGHQCVQRAGHWLGFGLGLGLGLGLG